jgi:hypothetical protein
MRFLVNLLPKLSPAPITTSSPEIQFPPSNAPTAAKQSSANGTQQFAALDFSGIQDAVPLDEFQNDSLHIPLQRKR